MYQYTYTYTYTYIYIYTYHTSSSIQITPNSRRFFVGECPFSFMVQWKMIQYPSCFEKMFFLEKQNMFHWTMMVGKKKKCVIFRYPLPETNSAPAKAVNWETIRRLFLDSAYFHRAFAIVSGSVHLWLNHNDNAGMLNIKVNLFTP